MKRFTSFLVVISMLLAMLPVVASATDDVPQLVDGYYEIYTADHLYWFADQVNGGNSAINGRLMADIVVNENVLTTDGELNGDGSAFRVWTPIGSNEMYLENPFVGVFEGNNRTISGLFFCNEKKDYIGMFGCVGANGLVSNLCIEGCYFAGRDYVGAIVGENFNGCVIKCINEGTIVGGNYVGGIAGGGVGQIDNCCNEGKIIGNDSVGGIAGSCPRLTNCHNFGIIYGNNYVGGVVGDWTNKIEGCRNCGFVYGKINVGGIAGINSSKMQRCYNEGDVYGATSVGGLAGVNEVGAQIIDCYNLSVISGLKYIGGIAGFNSDGGIMENCFNVNIVNGNQGCGGIVGAHYYGTISKCFYVSEVIPNSNNYGTAMNMEQFSSGEVAYLLGDSFGQTIGVDIYPILNGPQIYLIQIGGCNTISAEYEYTNEQNEAIITHNWTNATCTVSKTCVDCGLTEGEVLQHSFGDITVHKPAPGVTGYSEHTCTACGHTEQFDFVELQGFTVSGLINSFLLDDEIKIELLVDSEVQYSTVVVGSNVRYEIEDVVSGTYTLRISKGNHVTRKYEVVVGQEDVRIDAIICPIGDVTGDGLVNIKDFQRLLRHVNRTNPLEDYDLACGDVTGDGVCNIKDFQRLLRHVNKTNPLF